MTDEQLSELAECLEYVCQEAISKGLKVRPVDASYGGDGRDDPACNCPIGYLTGKSYPYAGDLREFANGDALWTFAQSYDKPKDMDTRPAAALGRLFRELYP